MILSLIFVFQSKNEAKKPNSDILSVQQIGETLYQEEQSEAEGENDIHIDNDDNEISGEIDEPAVYYENDTFEVDEKDVKIEKLKNNHPKVQGFMMFEIFTFRAGRN